MSDKRLLKLIQQCRTKQVLDYVKQHGEDAPKSTGNAPAQNQKSAKSKKSKKSESSDSEPTNKFNVKRHTADTVKVFIDLCFHLVSVFFLYQILTQYINYSCIQCTIHQFRSFLKMPSKMFVHSFCAALLRM